MARIRLSCDCNHGSELQFIINRDVKLVLFLNRTLSVKFNFIFKFILLYQHVPSLSLQSPAECNKITRWRTGHLSPHPVDGRHISLHNAAVVMLY